MRNFVLRTIIVLVATAAVTIISFALFPLRGTILWFEFVGSLLVSFSIFLLIAFLQPVYAKRRVWLMLFVGLLIYYIGTLIDAIDEIVIANQGLDLIEGIALPVGIVLSIGGFFLLLRNQRQAQKTLEEHRSAFEKLSITDELTGLYNSRHFYEQLRIEMQRSLRYERKLSVVLIDIDDFKKHNDSYGHIEGDHVLRRLGELITKALRGNDSGYRYGGEEFTIILPETGEDQAIIVAERIRTDFKAAEFAPEGTVVCKTLSAGVAQFALQDDVSMLIRKADQAMYLAKRRGKDQIAVYADTNGPTKSE